MDGYDPNQQSRIQYMDESHPARDPWYGEKCGFENQKTMRCLPFTTCHIGHPIHYDMTFHYTHMIAFIHLIIYFMQISMDQNGTKTFHGHAVLRILSHAFVRS